MARVFLSYARNDLKRAKTVAKALEKAGHRVWWDRKLAAGSKYSEEIASALESAEVVVVLWSRASTASAWVRDEAAKGRDSGRLVPASLDGTEPPLGFGQYQTVDLSGRGRSTRELVDAVARKQVASGGGPADHADSTASGKTKLFKPVSLVVAVAVLVMIGLLGWRFASNNDSKNEDLVLAVMPFADMSPGRDKSHLGEGIAEEIMTLVSGTPGLRVIGRTSAWQLSDGGIEKVREKLGATHLLEGSVRTSGSELRVGTRLIDTRSGEEVWSEEYRRPLSGIFSVQEEIGTSVAQRLRGTVSAALEQNKVRSMRTSPEAYDLYLAARAVGRRRDYQSQLEAEQLLERALAIDPDYAPAHAYLAITLEIQDNQNPAGADQNNPKDVARALRHARRAVELAPWHAESHLALGMVLDGDPQAALEALARGKKLDPGNFYAWNISGVTLNGICRYAEAAENFERATQIEPLLYVPYSNLMDSLLRSGKTAEAEQLVERFAATRADPPRAHELRAEYLYSIGDLAESFRSWRAAAAAGVNAPNVKHHLGRLLIRFGHVDTGIATLPETHRRLVGSYVRGDYADAAAAGQEIGAKIWDMPGLAAVASKAMVHAGRSEELVRQAEHKWGGIAQLIRNPQCRLHEWGPALVIALRHVGRDREAQALLQAAKAEHRLRVSNGIGGYTMHTRLAALLALEGRADDAINELERSVSLGWLDQGAPYFVGVDDPAFVSLHDHPRFGALSQRIKRRVEAEAAQIKAELASVPTARGGRT